MSKLTSPDRVTGKDGKSLPAPPAAFPVRSAARPSAPLVGAAVTLRVRPPSLVVRKDNAEVQQHVEDGG